MQIAYGLKHRFHNIVYLIGCQTAKLNETVQTRIRNILHHKIDSICLFIDEQILWFDGIGTIYQIQ